MPNPPQPTPTSPKPGGTIPIVDGKITLSGTVDQEADVMPSTITATQPPPSFVPPDSLLMHVLAGGQWSFTYTSPNPIEYDVTITARNLNGTGHADYSFTVTSRSLPEKKQQAE
jgi:hypothetical protein